jgi:hypothetical protein
MHREGRFSAAEWYSNFPFKSKNHKRMGKDREGKFHPRKGKPTGPMKTEGGGLRSINTQSIDDRFELADKYTIGEEEPAANVHVRHPNRNTDKREERQTDKFDFKNNKARNETFRQELDANAAFSAEEIRMPLTKDKFASLANYKSNCCVTIVLPTHASGAAVNEQADVTSFKTALQQVALELKGKKMDEGKIQRMLKPGFDLLRSDSFWKQMASGIAVFIAEEQFQYLKMPITPKEEVIVNTSFHLGALLPLIMNNDYFYLLVLSKKQARLYRADAFEMIHIPISEMPNGVDDVVHFEEKDDQKLFRTGSSGAGGGANYHGIGSGKPDEKENLSMYFDEVDETLWKTVLHTENVPLLLAGVDYLIPLYKQVAQYKPIWNEALTGNHDFDDMRALYEAAKEKMKPYFAERHKRAIEAFGNHSGKGTTSFFPDDVIAGAYYKRVWHLFVAKGAQLWGKFDEMSNILKIHPDQQEGDEDLIDKAIIHTILNAGEVHQLPLEEMPGKSMLAALFRY